MARDVEIRPDGEDLDPKRLQCNVAEASRLLRALGNERRLLILCLLLNGEKTVGELVRAVGLSQSALSQHLARLRQDGLVQTRRSAQTIYYAPSGSEAHAMIAALYRLYCRHEGEPGYRAVGEIGDGPRVSA